MSFFEIIIMTKLEYLVSHCKDPFFSPYDPKVHSALEDLAIDYNKGLVSMNEVVDAITSQGISIEKAHECISIMIHID